ncbi:uncharacterized protein LOC126743848 [Anthonomus grandis grandis]|uniref:uncharacterized protein LOC126743848 n=1 Tax=Anthonomus grandis grandis TaxID=2921223 RepID=UPI002165274A|nr:uncharacterized protein LOC126743848 [Anthonomus grandis grandis]
MNGKLEQLKRELTEMFYYGCTSTQVYTDYVEYIDLKIKCIMVQIAEVYEEHAHMDKDQVNELLGKQYQELWLELAEHLKKFNEEIQDIFEIPKDCVDVANMVPEDCFQPKAVEKLEKEIEELQQRFNQEKFYLESLKQKQEIIERVSQQLSEEKINRAKAIQKTAKRDADLLKELNQKKQEEINKLLENSGRGYNIKAMISRNVNEENTEKVIEKIMKQVLVNTK